MSYWSSAIRETDKDPQSRHYDAGGFETLDVIKAKLTPEQYEGFLLGNIIKYSCRLNFKDQNPSFWRTRSGRAFFFFTAWRIGRSPCGSRSG